MTGSTCPALDGRSCVECPVGRVADTDRGQFCPLVTRSYRPGDLLAQVGQPGEYLWFVVRGVLARASADDPGNLDDRVVAGHFAGLECLLGRPYGSTVQAVTPAVVCGATREGFLNWVAQSEQRKALVTQFLHSECATAHVVRSERGATVATEVLSPARRVQKGRA